MSPPVIRTLDPFPRNQRPQVQALVGKKVVLSTRDFHYVVGRLLALDSDDRLHLGVKADEVIVRRESVATLREADAALVEYIK